MRPITPLLLAAVLFPALAAQEPLSPDAALGQLYPNFIATTHTAQWVCVAAQHSGEDVPWPCSAGSSKVVVSALLTAQFREGNVTKAFLVSSAHLTDELVPDCHACQPAIGMAVFAWQSSKWVLESANPVVGMYGSWGSPPFVELLNVGPDKYGILLSKDDGGQGYHWSEKHLLVPIGNTVKEAWSIQDEQDNSGAVDPSDPNAPHKAYRSSAAFRFNVNEYGSAGSNPYYDIEVISRGIDRQDYNHPLRSEDWKEIYRFRDGKYRLLKRTEFKETGRQSTGTTGRPK